MSSSLSRTKAMMIIIFSFLLISLFLHANSSSSTTLISFSIPLHRTQQTVLSNSLRSSHRRKTLSSDVVANVFPNTANHLMEFSIGTPPMKVRGIIDSGSDLIWSRCNPCVECTRSRDFPVFNPNSSSSFRELSCDSSFCRDLDPQACSKSETCKYLYAYGDGSSTSGVLSSETLTFTSSANIAFPNIAFGCGYNNSPSIDNHQVGIVGLGGQPYSLVSQLGPHIGYKFSYCLAPFDDNSSASVITFGDSAIFTAADVVSTPLVDFADKTYYFVTLNSITVGGSIKIDASTGTVNTPAGKGNMFIDSGTTVTLLNTRVFNELVAAVTKIVKLPMHMDPGNTFACYYSKTRDVFPDMVFEFDGGAKVKLRPYNTLSKPSATGELCLAMQATNGAGIFGNTVQHNFHIGYDLKRRRVSFKPAICSKMAARVLNKE